MTGADFLLPIAAGAAISWASYSVVAHAVSKQHISTLRATVWGALGTLSLVLGVCAFSAVGAEHQTARKDIVCADDNPECYAKTGRDADLVVMVDCQIPSDDLIVHFF